MKWGLIGASDIAETRVIPALRANNQEISSVTSSDRVWADKYAEKNRIPKVANSLDELLDSNIEAVYISSTNEKHFSQAIAAIDKGKHVLCEKPIATNLDEAKAMVAAAKKRNVIFATNHHIRTSGSHQLVRKLIVEGKLGELIAVRINHGVSLPQRLRGWRLTSPEAGAGVILDIVVHDVDALRHLLGSNIVKAVGFKGSFGLGNSQVEDTSVCTFQFESGVIATSIESFVMPFNETSLEVNGSKGSVVIHNAMTQDPVGRVTFKDHLGTFEIPVTDTEDLYVKTIRQFLTGNPYASGDDGIASLQGALMVLDSIKQQKIIEVSK